MECLVEIQKSYVNIPKPLRLRTEKWCEKLANSGGTNRVWQKSRNNYAKLLLGMVCNCSFEEPFHVMPNDGALPTFPSYLKSKLKSSFGPHESAFWRQLYGDIRDQPTDKSEQSISEKETKTRENFSRFTGVISNQKEIQTLSLLAREQEQRIMILEQQLRDERLSHELEIQRLNYSHRIEGGVRSSSSEDRGSGSPKMKSLLLSPRGKLNASSSQSRYNDVESDKDASSSSFYGDYQPSHLSVAKLNLSTYDPPAFANHSSGRGRSGGAGGLYEVRNVEEEDEDFLNYIDQFQQEIQKSINSGFDS